MLPLKLIGSQKIKFDEDDTVVFNRPKYFVGSSGSVWASGYMRLRVVEPKLFMINGENQLAGKPAASIIAISDQLKYYKLATNQGDLHKILNDVNCMHRKYEIRRASSVFRTVTTSLLSIENEELIDQDITCSINRVVDSCSLVIEELKFGEKMEILEGIQYLNDKCAECCEKIKQIVPKLKSRIHESPGVSVNNLDV